MPGMPKLPFLLLGGGAAAVGMKIRKTQKEAPIAEAKAAKTEAAKDNLENLLRVEPLAIEVGLGLIGMVGGAQESRRRQPCATQPRVRDFAQGRGNFAL